MDDNTELVSIGIPTYNRADGYLSNTLESALNQTYRNIDIIVSDNGSTDFTEEVIKKYKDKRIRYFKHDKNIGANNNFNFCLEQARGAYFILLHDDDLIDPDFIEICMRALGDSQRPGFIRTGTRVIDSDGKVVSERVNVMQGKSFEEFIIKWFENETSLYMCSTLFNTELLKHIGGFESKTHLYQDVIAEAILAAKYGRVDVYDVKASFRRHFNSRGKAKKIDEWNVDAHYLLETICDLIPTNKNTIRKIGLIYFSSQNYKRASRIPKFGDRWVTYFKVYKSFHYTYSPFRFWLPKIIKSKIKALKRRIKLVSLK